jgi:hypothetical protein
LPLLNVLIVDPMTGKPKIVIAGRVSSPPSGRKIVVAPPTMKCGTSLAPPYNGKR